MLVINFPLGSGTAWAAPSGAPTSGRVNGEHIGDEPPQGFKTFGVRILLSYIYQYLSPPPFHIKTSPPPKKRAHMFHIV